MSQALANAVRGQALALSNLRSFNRKGLVSGYDPARHAVKVTLQPEGYETGWMPLGAVWVGAQFGMLAGPTLGDMVEVSFEDGAHDAGAVGLRFFNDEDTPPQVPSGELWIVHASGASAKFTNDGALTFTDPSGVSLTLANSGLAILKGDLLVQGRVTATGEGVFKGHTVSAHTHSGVQSGTSQTQPPNG